MPQLQVIKDFFKKHRWLNWLLQILLILTVFLGVRAWQLRDAVMGEAPLLAGKLITGEMINLEDYRGQSVLVYFWATWCPVCKISNGSIDAIADDRPVITIASWSESEAEVVEYLGQKSLDMPVLVDTQGFWAREYGVRGVPASFIVDKDGMVRFVESGYTTEWGLRLRLWWLDS